jgi:hypothetical protein
MQTLTQVREEILELLKADYRFEGVTLLSEFSGARRHLPVKETTIAVGINRVELAPAALGGYVGETVSLSHGRRSLCGPLAEITLRFDCWRPQNEDFGSLFIESVYECLLPVTGLRKIWCEAITPEQGALANHLRIFASVQTLLVSESESSRYDEIVLKRIG